MSCKYNTDLLDKMCWVGGVFLLLFCCVLDSHVLETLLYVYIVGSLREIDSVSLVFRLTHKLHLEWDTMLFLTIF